MPKTTNLNLELTTDASTYFEDWRKSLNGQGSDATDYSNTQIIDNFAGNFSGGTAAQYFGKTSSDNFDMGWKTADTTPTADSTNLATSGGVHAAIGTATSAIDTGKSQTVVLTGDVVYNLAPDVFYDFTGALTSLSLTFNTAVSGRENEYKGQFLSGASAPTITFPASISWVGEFPTIEASKTYQFSVVNNIGVIIGV